MTKERAVLRPPCLDVSFAGYMPGHLTWKFGEKLKACGFEIVNQDITGATYQDRKMLTGDSPLAANALGKLAARALLEEVGKKSFAD
ncbi:hypothetical protein [Photobacterium atrarenae]|uniref:DJ-1/PfpI domain-containing protein n=1 Tax=Photobacterium atrarenae TaxID=865757 RepID=A0ABY5GC32_9GAMM|nr:hypothetical protein [Photobacterium atrarenae]UTV26365.1 hypothetical protein NNL38_08200 [Photobacterium atrarenae]